jgi:glycosyltransferase involved in cell wall biosynthesis
MRLAVAIVTRCRPSHLAECLATVGASPLVDEVVVSSDGVDLETDEIAYAAQQQFATPLVYTRGPRTGPDANRDACIAAVTAQYVLLLDDGARLSRGFLEVALPLVGPRRLVTSRQSRNAIEPSGRRGSALNSTIVPTAFMRVHPFLGAGKSGGEDVDIVMRAAAAGYEVVHVDVSNVHVTGTAAHIDVARRRSGRILSVPPTPSGESTSTQREALPARFGTSAGHIPLRVSVVIPTYRRPCMLAACLDGLRRLTHNPHEIIVARHVCDDDSSAVLAARAAEVAEVVVRERGQVVQMLAGARRATGDVIAFLDDDAVPRRDWLDWLLAHYGDPRVGCVGGRDVLRGRNGEVIDGTALRVGRVSPWGRVTGNHHLGIGGARDVEILKGVNCSYRREVLALPAGLRGRGAPVAADLAASLRVSVTGHRAVYEPRALVDHYPGPRFDGDDRTAPSLRAVLDQSYNVTFALASLRPELRWRRLAYTIAVGDRVSPGLLRTLVGHMRGEETVTGRMIATARTAVRAVADARAHPLRFVSPDRVDIHRMPTPGNTTCW